VTVGESVGSVVGGVDEIGVACDEADIDDGLTADEVNFFVGVDRKITVVINSPFFPS
jgi:hypothetical protein